MAALTRRSFLASSATLGLGLSVLPTIACGQDRPRKTDLISARTRQSINRGLEFFATTQDTDSHFKNKAVKKSGKHILPCCELFAKIMMFSQLKILCDEHVPLVHKLVQEFIELMKETIPMDYLREKPNLHWLIHWASQLDWTGPGSNSSSEL